MRIGEEPHFPSFLEEVLVRKRHWRRGVLLEPTCEKVKYLCPAWDHHGHWVLKEDNTKIVTRYFLKRLTTPVSEATWLALETELEDGLTTRRRLREKTHPMVRKAQEEEVGRGRQAVRRDPETHGDIPAGKGSPPPAYFERMKGRGKGRGKDEEEEEKGGAKGGKKGRRVGSSHGDHGEALGLMSQQYLGKGPEKGLTAMFHQDVVEKVEDVHPFT